MYQNESQKAAQYLGLYSTLTRSVLNCSNNELITLEEEINTLKNYIEIEKMRMGDSFSYYIFIDEDVETDFTHVPPLMLQPFVENAIHHGLKNLSDRKGNLVINVTQMEEHVRVEIIDNGPGINHTRKENRSDAHESMGIKIFKQRMDLIKKKYKKTINFAATDLSEIDPGQTGTIITIEFPLIYPND
jgi:LytS/YehU family sensor histidine kinase